MYHWVSIAKLFMIGSPALYQTELRRKIILTPLWACLVLLLCCYRPVSFAGEREEQGELNETSFYFLDNLRIILASLGGWEGALWGGLNVWPSRGIPSLCPLNTSKEQWSRRKKYKLLKTTFVELAYGNVGGYFETIWAASLGVFKYSITYTYIVEMADEWALLSLVSGDIPFIFGILSKHILTRGTK